MGGPIAPSKVTTHNKIPEGVFQAFNELIEKNWKGGEARILQDEAVSLASKYTGMTRQKIFKEGLLDVESSYRKKGWKVKYDKPGYCESYEAYFVFSKK